MTRLLAVFLLLSSLALGADIRGTDTTGAEHALSATANAGTPVVLVFWQAWCAPCAKEAPKVQAASVELGERAQFFGVVSGPDKLVDSRKVTRWIDTHKLSYPQLRDRDGSISKTMKVKGTPTILVLGAEDKILYRGKRLPENWDTVLP